MILVVADTAPLSYLVQIRCEFLLPRLYARVFIPGAVLSELRHEGTPVAVRKWAADIPSWVEVRELDPTRPVEHDLAGLDPGEREAIELACQVKADLLLIDERMGALVARRQGFAVTGTLGVLVEAAQAGLVSIKEAIRRLEKTNFRRTPELLAQVLDLVRKRRGGDR